MSISGRTTPDPVARTFEAANILFMVGALLLLMSLLVKWYEPSVEASDAFEAWDLVLLVLGIVALVAAASRFGYGPPRPASWFVGAGLAALLIVLQAVIDPPPAAAGAERAIGVWIALAGTALMAAGGLMSVARISIAIADATGPAAAAPPGTSSRFMRGRPAPIGEADRVPPTEPTRPL